MNTKDKTNYTFIFDFDGTLVDSMETYVKSVISVLEKNKIEYHKDIFKIITPMGYLGSAKYFIKELGLTMPLEEIIVQMKDVSTKAYENDVLAKDTVINTLKALKDKGHSLNVLTASPHSNLDACLKRLGIWELFDCVWSCEDFNTTKDDVNIYYEVAKKLNTIPQSCVFLDDNINAVLTAKKAGMKTIGVYDKTAEDYVEEMKKAADMYIYKFEELLIK